MFLGKWPLERKNLPKIIEYLYLTFSNIFLTSIALGFLWVIFNAEQLNTDFVLETLTKPTWRVLTSIFIANWILNMIFSIHIFYILSKTETFKWSGIIAVFLSVLPLFAFAIPFAVLAYTKNEIAFE